MSRDANESCLDVVLELIHKAARDHALPHRFAAGEALVDAGMTSMAMVELMFAVEARFDITIPDVDLTPSNFRSGECIAEMVTRVAGARLPAIPAL